MLTSQEFSCNFLKNFENSYSIAAFHTQKIGNYSVCLSRQKISCYRICCASLLVMQNIFIMQIIQEPRDRQTELSNMLEKKSVLNNWTDRQN